MLHFEQLYGVTLVSVNPKRITLHLSLQIRYFATGKKESKHGKVIMLAYKCGAEDGIILVASHCLPACFSVVVYQCGSSDVLVLVTMLFFLISYSVNCLLRKENIAQCCHFPLTV
jgi:hypothetical protein